MSTFFKLTAQERINRLSDRFPLLKINQILDWNQIEHRLITKKIQANPNQQGKPSYPPLPMFKAILLGQWHNLSDPELEKALLVRLDFTLFCDFDDIEIPDHSTLCRYRNWLIQSGMLPNLLKIINRQLEKKQLKVEKALAAVVDATIINTAGGRLKKALETDENGEVQQTKPSKDSDARWVKKGAHFHLGYKQHTRTDAEGYIDALYVTAANEADVSHFARLISDLTQGCRVFADKGYASKVNREMLKKRKLKDGIMHKGVRGRSLTKAETMLNKVLTKTRYVVEQSFGTLKRIFEFDRARYFGVEKVEGQAYLKAMCLNLLKGANKLRRVAS